MKTANGNIALQLLQVNLLALNQLDSTNISNVRWQINGIPGKDEVIWLLAETDEIVSAGNSSVGIQEGSLCIDVDMDVHSRKSLRLDDEAFVADSFAYDMAASRFEDVIWHEFRVRTASQR